MQRTINVQAVAAFNKTIKTLKAEFNEDISGALVCNNPQRFTNRELAVLRPNRRSRVVTKSDLERLNAFREQLKHSRSSNQGSSCSRCNGLGMGEYRHIQNGVCFNCGAAPSL